MHVENSWKKKFGKISANSVQQVSEQNVRIVLVSEQICQKIQTFWHILNNTYTAHLDDFLIRFIVNLDGGDCLFHISKNHIQMLIICLQKESSAISQHADRRMW